MAAKKKAAAKKPVEVTEGLEKIRGPRQLSAEEVLSLVTEVCKANNAQIVVYPAQPEYVANQPDGGVLVRFPPGAWGVSLLPSAPNPG